MDKRVQAKMERLLARRRRKESMAKAAVAVGCAAVLCIICVLVVPALTAERHKTLDCSPVHGHTAACYDGEGNVVCGYADFVLHTHNELCYDDDGALICHLPEIEAHVHTDECYMEVPVSQPHQVDADPLPGVQSAAEAHTHDDSCYETVLTCGMEEGEGHTHGDECYKVQQALACGLEAHTHGAECYRVVMEEAPGTGEEQEAAGGLICELEEHSHADACYREERVLICRLEEAEGHTHSEACQTRELTCGREETGSADESALIGSMADGSAIEDGSAVVEMERVLVCGKQEAVPHTHDDGCWRTYTDEDDEEHRELICDIPEVLEHVHTQECVEEVFEGQTYLDLFGLNGDETSNEEPGTEDTRKVVSLNNNYLTTAKIVKVDGVLIDPDKQPMDPVDPTKSVGVSLGWEIPIGGVSKDCDYVYNIPDKLNPDGLSNGTGVLRDPDGNALGSYEIKGNQIIIKFNETTGGDVKFNVNFQSDWNWEGELETTINWGCNLKQDVTFDTPAISIMKQTERAEDDTLANDDGYVDDGYVIWYKVVITADALTNGIQLSDTLEADKFHFYQGAVRDPQDPDGTKYDYSYEIVRKDEEGTETTQMGYGTFAAGEPKNGTVTFPALNELPGDPSGLSLKAGETCTIRYAVKLDGADRVKVDQNGGITGADNTVEATYPDGTKDTTVEAKKSDTYRGNVKWINKQKGETNADMIPWTVTVNGAKSAFKYGMVVSDTIMTPGVHYNLNEGITVSTNTTEARPTTLKWVEVDAAWVNAVYWSKHEAYDRLFNDSDAGGKACREALEKAAGVELTKDNISNYVFVSNDDAANNSDKVISPQFVWFAPKSDEVGEYKLNYYTDASGANAEDGIQNRADAGWQGKHVGITVGTNADQKVQMTKEAANPREGTEDDEGKYFVDWTITLTMEPGYVGINNVTLVDIFSPIKINEAEPVIGGEKVNVYDWLVIPNSDESLSYQQFTEIESYRSEVVDGAFVVETDSKEYKRNWEASLGGRFETYKGDTLNYGQFGVTDTADPQYAGARVTPYAYKIYLGDLPGGGDDGYTITIKYTTQVPPELVDQFGGVYYGGNWAALYRNWGQINADPDPLVSANASYNFTLIKEQDVLEKNARYDGANKELTYEVEINRNKTLRTPPGKIEGGDVKWGYFLLEDQLDLADAAFIENSFQLTIMGSFDGTKGCCVETGGPTVIWKPSWAKAIQSSGSIDWKELEENGWANITSEQQAIINEKNAVEADMAKCNFNWGSACVVAKSIQFRIDDGGKKFSLIMQTDLATLLGLFGTEDPNSTVDDRKLLIPMELSYHVKLPAASEATSITNKAWMSEVVDGTKSLLDEEIVKFNYTSGLYKEETGAPSQDNGYVATFQLDIDTRQPEWQAVNNSSSFTVVDTMSPKLVWDRSSVQVKGLAPTGGEAERFLREDEYQISFASIEGTGESQVSITIKNRSFQRYVITYKASLATTPGETGESISYSNIAQISGTTISSQEVKKSIVTGNSSGSASINEFKIVIQKWCADNTNKSQDITFELHKWNKVDAWEPITIKNTTTVADTEEPVVGGNRKFTTENGTITLKNEYNDYYLSKDTWYKVVEVKVADGYDKVDTYFYCGDLDKMDKEHLPPEVKDNPGKNAGPSITVDIYNPLITFELPETGSRGLILFTFGGLILAASALSVWKLGKRRRPSGP